MPRKIPAAIMKKLYSKSCDSAFLTVCTITTEDSVLRVVNNQKDIEYNGNTYTGTHFTVVLPDDQEDTVPSATLVFADTGNVFLDLIRNYDEIFCDMEVVAAKTTGNTYLSQPMASSSTILTSSGAYLSSSTVFVDDDSGMPMEYVREQTTEVFETKVGPYELLLSNASGDASTATFTISSDDISDYQFPNMTFNSIDFPSIY